MFDVNELLDELTNAKSSTGATKLWKLDMDKVAVNKAGIMNLPLQARVVVKAILTNAQDGRSFTFEDAAEWAAAAGLETRQPAIRIVRYYGQQLRKFVIVAAK